MTPVPGSMRSAGAPGRRTSSRHPSGRESDRVGHRLNRPRDRPPLPVAPTPPRSRLVRHPRRENELLPHARTVPGSRQCVAGVHRVAIASDPGSLRSRRFDGAFVEIVVGLLVAEECRRSRFIRSIGRSAPASLPARSRQTGSGDSGATHGCLQQSRRRHHPCKSGSVRDR